MSKKTFGSLLVLSGALLLTYLKFNKSQNRKCKEEQSVLAVVISKESKTEMYATNQSSGIGCLYTVKFKLSDGRGLELSMCEAEFNGLKVGMKGKLTYKGDKFIKFREIVDENKEESSRNVVVKEEPKEKNENCKEEIYGLRELTDEEALELIKQTSLYNKVMNTEFDMEELGHDEEGLIMDCIDDVIEE